MSSEDPIVRLREGGGSDVARRLLASASRDEMTDDQHRALVEWGAGAFAQSEAAGGAARVTPLMKGLGALALIAASVGAFSYVSSNTSSSRDHEATSPASEVTANAVEAQPSAPSGEARPPAPVVTLDDLPNAPATVPTPTSSATVARAGDVAAEKKPAADDMSIAEQMKFIDRARTSLRQGNARGSLAVLDEYERRFAAPAFKEEATVLRVSALAKAGDRAAAKRIGEAFLDAHPSELYSRRVEAIVRSLDQDGTP